jgi:multiple sugar transport system substrate-binding protein
MAKKRETTVGQGVDRRAALKTIGTASAFVAGAAATGHWKRSFAATDKEVELWSTQVKPTQLPVWKTIIAAFEKENPGITVNLSKVSSKDVMPKLTTAYVSDSQPDVVAGGNALGPASLHLGGKVHDLSDLTSEVGDFEPGMVSSYNVDGYQTSLSLGLTVISTMWTRNDLLKAEGLGIPKSWDDLLTTAKRLNKGGKSGVSLPYGKTQMTAQVIGVFVRQAGGDILAPDGSVAFNSPGAVRALEFMKEIRPYAPMGANTYSYGDTLGAFVSGHAGIGMYTGRALINVHERNPAIEDHIAADFYPYPADGHRIWLCGYDPFYMPKGKSPRTEQAKLFARYFFKPEVYVKWVQGAPGHQLPVTKSVTESDEFNSNPIIKKHKGSIDKMLAISRESGTDIHATPGRPANLDLGLVLNSLILAEAVQKVIVNKESPKATAVWAHDKIAALLKG